MATTFTLVDDGDGKFVLDGNIVKTAALLDYETATSYNITVSVAGADAPVSNGSFTIDVTDVITQTIVLSNSTMSEDITNGTVIGELSVLEGTGTYVFTITSDPDNLFSLDTPFEETAGFVDYEVASSHEVTIQADNGVDPPFSQTFTITVTDVVDTIEPPAPSGITTTMTVGRGIYITQATARQYMSPSGVYINEEL